MTIFEKIKLLFKVQGPAGELVEELKTAKSSWKSPKFWVALLGTLGALTAGLTGILSPTASLFTSSGIAALYNIVKALEDSNQPFTSGLFVSTKFWLGTLAAAQGFFLAVKTGGVDPVWVESSLGALGLVMTFAQNLAAQQPKPTPQ